jgi:hypothetical protein
MSMKIDKTIERMVIFRNEKKDLERCPRCNQPLVQYPGPYQVATFDGSRPADEFVMGGDFGYLCAGCATAVIHLPALAEMLHQAYQKPGWDVGGGCGVIGLINLDAIPPDQRHLPLDDLDPYPLVHFYADSSKVKKRGPQAKPRKPKPRFRKKKS